MKDSISPKRMRFFHSDTYGIANDRHMSIPSVSHRGRDIGYHLKMPSKNLDWKTWGLRFRKHCREQGTSLRKISEKMGLAESTLRSWTNGTREINLSDFFALCQYSGADPCQILFGAPIVTPEKRQEIGDAVARILEANLDYNDAKWSHEERRNKASDN